MLKCVSVVVFCFFSFISMGYAEEDMKVAGAGVIVMGSPYQGIGSQSLAVPIVVWDYQRFYIKGQEIGYHFYQQKMWRWSVLLMPRLMGYHSSDSDTLQGMEDRVTSLDAGIKGEWFFPWPGTMLTMKCLSDILSRSDGQEMEVNLSQELKGNIWRLIPSIGIRVQSGRLTDYYYGVRSSEMRPWRPEYAPGTAMNYFADTLIACGISNNWVVIMKGEVEYLAPEIRKSPIVDKGIVVSGVFGLVRRF